MTSVSLAIGNTLDRLTMRAVRRGNLVLDERDDLADRWSDSGHSHGNDNGHGGPGRAG